MRRRLAAVVAIVLHNAIVAIGSLLLRRGVPQQLLRLRPLHASAALDSEDVPPFPFAHQAELELRIESLSNLGEGVARVRLPSEAGAPPSRGWVVFVPQALPGELVSARVEANFDGHSRAVLAEVLTPSPARVEPACRLSGSCGGCQYQHLHCARTRTAHRTGFSLAQRASGCGGAHTH